MKKHFFKITALLLCVCMLSVSLCSCDLWVKIDTIMAECVGSVRYTLPNSTEFRIDPSFDSPVVAVLEAGITIHYGDIVTQDGVTWALSSDGWFVLENSNSPPISE